MGNRRKIKGFYLGTLRNFQDPASPLKNLPFLSDKWYNIHRILLLSLGVWYLFFFIQHLKGNFTFYQENMPRFWSFFVDIFGFLFFQAMALFYVIGMIFSLLSFLVPDNRFIDTWTRAMTGFHTVWWLVHFSVDPS
jgi:hypothetical protein